MIGEIVDRMSGGSSSRIVSSLSPARSHRSAAVGSVSPGAPVWDVVADYLRAEKTVRLASLNEPVLKGVSGNLGLGGQT